MKTLQMSFRPIPTRPKYMIPLMRNYVNCKAEGGDCVAIKSCINCRHLGKINFATVECNNG